MKAFEPVLRITELLMRFFQKQWECDGFLLNNQNVNAHFTIIKMMQYLDYSSGKIKKSLIGKYLYPVWGD